MEYPTGWTCERAERQLEAYLLSRLVLAEALALAEHLEACPSCPERLVLYRMTLRRTRA
jgi:anti-sigma factor RsiW